MYESLARPRQEWLDGLRHEAEQLFDGIIDDALVWEFSFDRTGQYDTVGVSANQVFRASYRTSHALMPAAMWRRGHLDDPVPTLLGALGGDVEHPAYRAVKALGVLEMAGAVGLDPSGQGVTLAWFRRQTGVLPPSVRHTLERIAAHLGRAVRLRNTPAADEDAVLAADGKLVHAERDAREPESREALQRAARQIERARLKTTAAASPEEALDLWNALVEGRWSLVERFESDGRRILVARRNDPTTHRTRALTEMERKVAALLAIGHSQKLIAYELGVQEPAISKLATSVLGKLGVRGRAELIELQGAIVGTSDDA